MTAQPRREYTPAEYLARERASDHKSEFYAGEIFALAGGSEQHNLISGNVFEEADRNLLRDELELDEAPGSAPGANDQA